VQRSDAPALVVRAVLDRAAIGQRVHSEPRRGRRSIQCMPASVAIEDELDIERMRDEDVVILGYD
jgi:hypothetical protein